MAKIRYTKAIKNENAKLWSSMRFKSNSWKRQVTNKAKRIIANKDRYEAISAKTNVPWQFIGVIHNRESGLNFSKHLHNGDSLNRKTRRVPANRPKSGKPPYTFEESAIDALKMKGFHRVKDWSIEHQCFMLERYNGFGYRYKGIPSPYLWSGSQHYRSGKYVADHKFSRTAVDKQMGVMPLLKRIYELDENVVSKKELRKTSKKMSLLKRIKDFILYLGGSVGALFTADTLDLVDGWWDRLYELAQNNVLLVVAFTAIAAYTIAQYMEDKTVEDHEEGRYEPSNDVT